MTITVWQLPASRTAELVLTKRKAEIVRDALELYADDWADQPDVGDRTSTAKLVQREVEELLKTHPLFQD